jgi:hypothetical protein
MSFSRLRRSNNPRPQNDDNYSNYSGQSNPQYQNQKYQSSYQNQNQNYQNQNYQKYENQNYQNPNYDNQNYQNQTYQKYDNQNYQNRQYNNDINKLQQNSNLSHASSETNSSATDQYICNNCINQALIDAKNKPKDYYSNVESPMDIQDRLNAMQKMRINDQVQQRIKRAEGVAKNLNYTSDKDKLIKENEGGNFFLNQDNIDYQKERAMEKYRQQEINLNNRNYNGNNPGVDAYYRNYVDNYKEPEDNQTDNKRLLQAKYNEELERQIEQNQKLKSKMNKDIDRRVKEEQDRENYNYQRKISEQEKRRQEMNDEFLRENENLVRAKNRRKQNDKLQDEYDEKKNQRELQRKLENEDLRQRELDEQKKRALQKDLDEQMRERDRRKKAEKERDGKYSGNDGFGECTCEGQGKCCCCKKMYPMSFLNPKRQYAPLIRNIKQRKLREQQRIANQGGNQ